MDLYHVSEQRGIRQFIPRPPPSASAGIDYPAVWAVDDEHLRNYLLPRDCPRVTFYQTPESSTKDIERLLGPSGSRVVVAIEAAWFARVREAILHVYTMPMEGFELIDRSAGYWVNRSSVAPIGMNTISDCLGEILQRRAELRVVTSLWPLMDAIVTSSLGFSCIRMRNARPRASKEPHDSHPG